MKKINLLAIFFFISILFSCKVWHISQSQVVNLQMDSSFDSVSDEDDISTLIKPFKDSLSASMNEVLGHTVEEMEKALPESRLGNWTADALFHVASTLYSEPIGCAFQNYGGIRVPYLPKGEIKVSNIYELMPFDNLIIVVKTKGSQLKKFFNAMAEGGGHPISEGTSYKMQNKTALNILIHDKPIQDDSIYHIALPDYVYNINVAFFSDLEVYNTGFLARDAFIEYAKYQQKTYGKIFAKLEGRLIKK
jgi:2',3'-cyclic-nucleotide 2'-phosphodiesterase (5'-nucleotidase family)